MNQRRVAAQPAVPPLPERRGGDPRLRYLDELQEPMEAIALGRDSNRGRFCGYCYARLAEAKGRRGEAGPVGSCLVCGHALSEAGMVDRVPAEALAIFMAKRKREGLIVNAFAFLGIFLSLLISALLWFLLPGGWWLIAPFAMLAVGSYYLARLLGLGIGASLGYNSGCDLRERGWSQYVAARSGGRAAAELSNVSENGRHG